MHAPDDFLDARSAAELLGIKLATLYAYTSRGLVKSVPGAKGRARLYLRTDIERLHLRQQGEGEPAHTSQRNEFVVETALVRQSPEGMLYSAHNALELARASRAFESVAELVWTHALEPSDELTWRRWQTTRLGFPAGKLSRVLPEPDGEPAPSIAVMQLVLATLAVRDADRFAFAHEAVLACARRMMVRLAASLRLETAPDACESALEGQSYADVVLRAFGRKSDRASAAAMDRALVLSIDDEPGTAMLASRAASAAGGDLYNAVSAALAVFAQSEAGTVCERIEATMDALDRAHSPARGLRDRLRRGEPVPGFSSGAADPRARLLLETARSLGGRGLRAVESLLEAAHEAGLGAPTHALAMVAIAHAIGLGRGAAGALMALGRTAGFIAHAIEQRGQRGLIPVRTRSIARTM